MAKNTHGLHIEKNAIVDSGDGLLEFTNGLVITDNSEQKNGTRYDIPSMDLSEYQGQVTADHIDSVHTLIGRVVGLVKQTNRVVISGIQFAVKENPTARLAYDLMRAGYLKAVSIETYGDPPDDNGVFHNAKLVGLSTVIVGNNNSAVVNEVALNSIAESRKAGLDTTDLEKTFKAVEAKPETPTKSDNAREQETKVADKTTDTTKTEDKVENKNEAPAFDQNALLEAIGSKMDEKVAPLADKIAEMEKNAFDKSAEEPKFEKSSNGVTPKSKTDNEFKSMDSEERTVLQVNAAIDMLTRHDMEAAQRLNAINMFHLNQLKVDGKIKNSMTIADFGNFVIAPEQLTEIQGVRTSYSALLDATEWKETLSTQMAWIERSGDIEMQSVEFCDDDADGNLKPISEYGATIKTSNLEEMAAVTPVCNAATRFLAADLLSDVQAGYRHSYDKYRAQLVIARLEQAVEENGNSEVFNLTSAAVGLVEPLALWAELADTTPNGSFIMNNSSYAQFLSMAVQAGVSGPLAQLFTTGNIPTLFGRPIVIVPNDLLPSLNTGQTRSFVVDGETVTVNHAVFYTDLSQFTGRVSGGLQYDIATQAAYEVGGQVKSAFQRNEIVLRGSFFRGGIIKDYTQVAGLLAAGVS